MRNSFLIAQRILKQLRHDPRFVILSIVAPFILILMLKIFVDALPFPFPEERYIMPLGAYIVHFIGFVLSMIILVQERKGGTLERMFVNGIRKVDVIFGYLFGYLSLVTLQTTIVIAEVLFLFEFDYSAEQILLIFWVTWLLSTASVSLGLFLSSFARHEGHVIPFIPLVAIPSMFLSGLIVDAERLPLWGEILGKFTPLHYATKVLTQVIPGNYDLHDIYFWNDYVILIGLALFFLLLTALSMREEVV